MTDEAQKIIAALRAECGDQTCGECPSWEWCHGDRHDKLDDDIADLIEKLSADLEAAMEREKGLSIMLTSAQSAAETYKRERDAAIADMEEMQGCICQMCKQYYQPDPNVRKWSCRVLGEYWADICEHDGGLLACSSFEWRGVQEDD
jgi:hypothetical protein